MAYSAKFLEVQGKGKVLVTLRGVEFFLDIKEASDLMQQLAGAVGQGFAWREKQGESSVQKAARTGFES
jgi:hypothetical protein